MSTSVGPQLHVLAVDDCPVDRKMIERVLKMSSCKATIADSAQKALELLGLGDKDDVHASYSDVLEAADMIITDYYMPEMTGLDLLKRLKSSALKEIPVMLLSSEDDSTLINRCLEEGAEEFLKKPLEVAHMEQLKDRMKKQSSDGESVKA